MSNIWKEDATNAIVNPMSMTCVKAVNGKREINNPYIKLLVFEYMKLNIHKEVSRQMQNMINLIKAIEKNDL